MSLPAHDPLEIALLVGAAIEAVGGAYFVGGSVASSLQGDPRATNDIDIVIDLSPRLVDAFADALGADFEVDRDMLREAILTTTTANAFYLPLLTKIDFFAVADGPFDRIEFERRRPVVVGTGDQKLVLKTPEDSALRKLLWFRQGGETSEKQWRDIVAIVKIVGTDLDDGYLDHWAALLRCTDLLQRARAEAGVVN